MRRLGWIAPVGWLAIPMGGCADHVSRVGSSEGTGTASTSGTGVGTSAGPDAHDDDPCCCLAAGTMVATPDGPRPIETLVEGMRVFSVDVESGRRVVTTVTAVRAARRECLALWLDGRTHLIATPDHPVYRPSASDYVPAGDFVTEAGGDVSVLIDDETFVVRTVERTESYVGVHRVYDITVESRHHNFVANGIVVHNKLDLASPPPDFPGDVPVCPEAEDVAISFAFEEGMLSSETVSTSTCIVAALESWDDEWLRMTFDCPETVIVLLRAPSLLDLFEGETVELSAGLYAPAWTNTYLALRRDGALLLAAMQGHALPGDPDEHAAPAGIWDPLTVMLGAETCEPDASEDRCILSEQRLTLALSLDDAETIVHDAATVDLGELVVFVQHAVDRDVACVDFPQRWFSLVALRPT
jgi:hypothetical protein